MSTIETTTTEAADTIAIDARDLTDLLSLDRRDLITSANLRRRALRHAHEGAGFRLACEGEVIRGSRAKGDWVVYRRARLGRWGRGPVVGRGVAPSAILHVRLKGIYRYEDVIRERVRLGAEASWSDQAATLAISRVADVWTVTREPYNPLAREPVPALWVENYRLRAGVVCRGIHAADADELRRMRAARAGSILAQRAAERRGDAPARWVSVGTLRSAGACLAGIEAAWPSVRDALGLAPDVLLEQVGAVSVEVVRRVHPEWAHAAI